MTITRQRLPHRSSSKPSTASLAEIERLVARADTLVYMVMAARADRTTVADRDRWCAVCRLRHQLPVRQSAGPCRRAGSSPPRFRNGSRLTKVAVLLYEARFDSPLLNWFWLKIIFYKLTLGKLITMLKEALIARLHRAGGLPLKWRDRLRLPKLQPPDATLFALHAISIR